ncbi:MAG TPA: AIR synthase-related protein [Candidatus Polarisedimenticolaceae bacterium]|nr:AIR synthase-related protein [Candidatus Polarisedimenticolaceae bacterium]
MVTRIEIAPRPDARDPLGEQLCRRITGLLGIGVEWVRTTEVYRVDARLTADEAARVLGEFVNPVSQTGALGRCEQPPFDFIVAVGYKPGVTDPVGKSARVAIEDTLGRPLGRGAAVYGSRLYALRGADRAQAERIATELLANPVIQTFEIRSFDEWRSSPVDLSVPRVAGHPVPPVATVDLSGSDEELLRISRDGLLALDLDEMRAIRDHFARAGDDERRTRLGLGGSPTDVELECIAQTWSEHCKHKIFNATIRYTEPGQPEVELRSLFDSFIRRTTETIDERLRATGRSWLVSVFHDNAGVVAFDERLHLVFKVETHNSPSALDPYGGAITGIVGVNRDPFGTGIGAELLVNVWGYCFADPAYDGELPGGLLHPRRIRDGVHQGVIDGGNQSGVPYGRGWELFDLRYLGKPLVFCGTVGALPVTVAGRPGEQKRARPGDLIVMTGGRIGADGIHGATFSSAALDESSPVQAVQIGDPITQKMMFDFLLEARGLGLYNAITDNGAGGLSSSVGEMARGAGGARLDLARAPLKYQGLAPWEILVSEAQERMTLAVPPDRIDRFIELARRREVEATVLGEFTDDGFFHLLYGDRTVARLDMTFLHGGVAMRLEARWSPPIFDEPEPSLRADESRLNETLTAMLGRLNLCSGEAAARHYDHEVKGLSVIKPFVGVGRDVPADATVFLAHHGSRAGFVLSEGVNPYLSEIDTEQMALYVVDEAVRKQLCAGARFDRIALLDNFCWPDPVRSRATPDGEYKLAQLVRACRGLARACLSYGTPLISGKDSMKNDSTKGGVKISVPPTLLVSAIGRIDDVGRARTLEPRAAGDAIFLLGRTADECGGSEYFRHLGERAGLVATVGRPQPYVGNRLPRVDPEALRPLYLAFDEAARDGLIESATAPAKGGLALALARCAMSTELGLRVDLGDAARDGALAADALLFSESGGRFVVTTRPETAAAFERRFAGLPCRRIGRVTSEPGLLVTAGARPWLQSSRGELARVFKERWADG